MALAYSTLDFAVDVGFAVVVLSILAIGFKRLVWRTSPQQDGSASVDDGAKVKAQEIAGKARSEAVLGVFIAGFLLGPVALWRVSKARKLLADADDSFHDLRRHLRHTSLIAVVALALWVLLLVFFAVQKGSWAGR